MTRQKGNKDFMSVYLDIWPTASQNVNLLDGCKNNRFVWLNPQGSMIFHIFQSIPDPGIMSLFLRLQKSKGKKPKTNYRPDLCHDFENRWFFGGLDISPVVCFFNTGLKCYYSVKNKPEHGLLLQDLGEVTRCSIKPIWYLVFHISGASWC